MAIRKRPDVLKPASRRRARARRHPPHLKLRCSTTRSTCVGWRTVPRGRAARMVENRRRRRHRRVVGRKWHGSRAGALGVGGGLPRRGDLERLPPGQGPGGGRPGRLEAADNDPGDWMSHGRTYGEQRFSPLDEDQHQQRRGPGPRLELRARHQPRRRSDPDRGRRGDVRHQLLEPGLRPQRQDRRTPWTYDPKVPREVGHNACCDVVNRGVAVWKGRVYVATLDGRLVALDAKTGNPGVERRHRRPVQALHHHHGAADRARQGDDRQWRRGIRRARLRLGL